MTELRRLDAVLQRIIAARAEHSRRFAAYRDQAEKRFRDNSSLENEVAFRLARIVADDDVKRSPASRGHPALLAAIYDTDMHAAWEAFVKAEPEWRKALEAVGADKLRAAEDESTKIEKKVTEDLVGFSDEVGNDPRLRHAKRRLSHAETLEARARDASGWKDWQSLLKDLANDES